MWTPPLPALLFCTVLTQQCHLHFQYGSGRRVLLIIINFLTLKGEIKKSPKSNFEAFFNFLSGIKHSRITNLKLPWVDKFYQTNKHVAAGTAGSGWNNLTNSQCCCPCRPSSVGSHWAVSLITASHSANTCLLNMTCQLLYPLWDAGC